MPQFTGRFEDLKAKIEHAGIPGTWSDEGGKQCFRSSNGGVLNWWPSRGTLQIQGRAEAAAQLTHAVEAPEADVSGIQSRSRRQIFIVHGHDTEARDQLELALHRLDLDPYVLVNDSGGGKTIIEALEGKIGRDFSSDFGIVLMTPDDIGYALKEGPEHAEPRARQTSFLKRACSCHR